MAPVITTSAVLSSGSSGITSGSTILPDVSWSGDAGVNLGVAMGGTSEVLALMVVGPAAVTGMSSPVNPPCGSHKC